MASLMFPPWSGRSINKSVGVKAYIAPKDGKFMPSWWGWETVMLRPARCGVDRVGHWECHEREMHAEPGLLESDVWCEGVVEDDWRCLLSKNKFLESWVVLTHCSLLVLPVSESARCSGCFSVPFCLSCFSSVSEHGCILPLQSAPISL